jgi:hypothetical protein
MWCLEIESEAKCSSEFLSGLHFGKHHGELGRGRLLCNICSRGPLCAERATLTFDEACTTLIPEQIAPVQRHSLSGLLQCSAS